MPRKPTASTSVPPQQLFTKELAGETPPSLQTLQRLYSLTSDLYGFRPWRFLEEDNLIVVRDSVSGELRFCSIMGSLGEVMSLHVYIGMEGLRQFHRLSDGAYDDPAELLAATHCIYVEFVKRSELLRQDKELLALLGHPQGRGLASPIFRTIRPGFLPWFVTEDEARILAECIRAVVVVCDLATNEPETTFWDSPDTFPMCTYTPGADSDCRIESFRGLLPPEPPAPAAQLPEATLQSLRSADYAISGVMELDLAYSVAAIGNRGERSACAAIALAVDAKTGIVFPPEVSISTVPAGDILASAFVKAVQTTNSLPREVKVRQQKFLESLAPLMHSFGVKIRLVKRLPAADDARSSLLGFFG